MMHDEPSEHEHSGYGIYMVTWLALLMLTALTVTVAGMHLQNFSVLTAVVIAAIKAIIVALFFMHLKQEAHLFKVMFLITIATLTIFISLTFVDILFR